jgi:hypothetical protein
MSFTVLSSDSQQYITKAYKSLILLKFHEHPLWKKEEENIAIMASSFLKDNNNNKIM